jgi:RNA polymerase sigma factor (sigma-70 family)
MIEDYIHSTQRLAADFPRLPNDEIEKAAARLQQLTGEDYLRERNRLICHMMGLVISQAFKYPENWGTYDREDFLQEAVLGLLKALESNDRTDTSFVGYATTQIRWALCKAMTRKARLVPWCKKEVASLDAPLSSGDDDAWNALRDLLAAPEPDDSEHDAPDLREKLVEVLSGLPTREGEIIAGLFGLFGETQTMEELAARFNMPKKVIVRQARQALIKLRHPERSKKLRQFIRPAEAPEPPPSPWSIGTRASVKISKLTTSAVDISNSFAN